MHGIIVYYNVIKNYFSSNHVYFDEYKGNLICITFKQNSAISHMIPTYKLQVVCPAFPVLSPVLLNRQILSVSE